MNISVRLASYLFIIMSSLFINAEVKAQVNRSVEDRIYITPLNFLNLVSPSAQLTFGRVLNDKMEVQVSFAPRLKYGAPLFIDVKGERVPQFVGLGSTASYSGGYRIGTEAQQFHKRKGRSTNYLAVELFFEYDGINYNTFELLNGQFFTDYKVIRQNIGLNFKVGRKVELGEKMILDFYGGLGFELSRSDFNNLDDEIYEINQIKGDLKSKLSFPVNIKLAYRL